MKALQFVGLTTCLVIMFGFGSVARGEAWLASHFANNCAACHAPARLNVEAPRRHCTLSCKSCHTNPNGGGLRNTYGKWNEERWLRSIYVDNYKLNKLRPAPADQQQYAEKVLKDFVSGVKSSPNKKVALKAETTSSDGIPKLTETALNLPESAYGRQGYNDKIVADPKDAEAHIPEDDPWRLRRANYFNAGLDFRYFDIDTVTGGYHQTGTMPMATDLGVSMEPYHGVTFVWESRFLSDPRTTGVWDDSYTTDSQVRSAYVMYDNLPYNSFAMYGIYKPMFGIDEPDHTTLFSLATGLDETATYKAFTIGASPGAPFFNLHLIQPLADRTMAQDRGFAFNAGARFTKLGAFIMLSWWDTMVKDWTANLLTHRQMSSVSGGFTKGRLTLTGDISKVIRDVDTVSKDTGTVITVEPRVRFWREAYVKGIWEYLNTAPDLRLGHSTQEGAGLGWFVVSGLELEIMYKSTNATEDGANVNERDVWGQAHVFF